MLYGTVGVDHLPTVFQPYRFHRVEWEGDYECRTYKNTLYFTALTSTILP